MLKILLWYGIAEACISVMFDGFERNLAGQKPKPGSPYGHIPLGQPVLMTVDGGEFVVGDWLGVEDNHAAIETLVEDCDEWVISYYPLHQVMSVEMLEEGEVAEEALD